MSSFNPDVADLRAVPQSDLATNPLSPKREKSRAMLSALNDISNRSLDLEEKLAARITQAQGVLNALSAAYDEDKDAFRTSPAIMKDALWAVSALLKQADKAQRKLGDEMVSLKRLADSDSEKA